MRKLRNQSEIELNGTVESGVTLWLSAKAFSRHKSALTAVQKALVCGPESQPECGSVGFASEAVSLS